VGEERTLSVESNEKVLGALALGFRVNGFIMLLAVGAYNEDVNSRLVVMRS
jgi:hypothetical protein